MSRECPRCGADVALVHLSGSGQRVLVNAGFIPVFVGQASGGSVTVGRVLHWQTCPAHSGIKIDNEKLTGVTNDGPWEPKEEKAERVQPRGKRRGRR